MTKNKLRTFYIPSTHKQKLNDFLKQKTITPTIEAYILNEYNGPRRTPQQLLEKHDDLEKIKLYLSEEAINKLDSFLHFEETGITRSHIFRDAVSEVVGGFSVEKVVENKLDDVLKELTQIAPKELIYEAIQKYQLKHYA